MAYCNQSDIENAIPRDDIEALSDDHDIGLDSVVVSAAIEWADSQIDMYIGGRYTTPLSTVPSQIKFLSVDLAKYRLYNRRKDLNMPEEIQNEYENAMTVLGMIKDDELVLSGITSISSEFRTNKTSDDKIYTSDIMDEYRGLVY